MRLIELKSENFKRLKAVRLAPDKSVTPIVGRNGQGKTSVIDSISAALGGAAEAPAMPIRKGQESAEVIVDLGDIKVRRRWTAKGSTLEVFSPDGAKYPGPQAVLDKLIGKLSFDPLEFSRLPAKAQAKTLAEFAGVDLEDFANKRRAVFDDRTAVNKQLKAAKAQLDGMPEVEAPDEEVSVASLIADYDAHKANNDEADDLENEAIAQAELLEDAKKKLVEVNAGPAKVAAHFDAKIAELKQQLLAAEKDKSDAIYAAEQVIAHVESEIKSRQDVVSEAQTAAKRAARIDLAASKAAITNAETTNAAVRQRKARIAKADEVKKLEEQAERLTARIEFADNGLAKIIAESALPIPGLTMSADGVMLNGVPFADCSGAEKLRASVAVAIAINPKLKLMLIRDGSLLDADGMAMLAEMAEKADAQVLIERVQNGTEVGVTIEDGEIVDAAMVVTPAKQVTAEPATVSA